MASPTLRSSTAPVSGLSTTTAANTAVGDLVIVHTWERTGAGVPTHTLESGYVEIFSQPHDDGSTDGRLSVAYKIATSGGAVAYQAYTSSVGTETWTGCQVLQVGTFDAARIRAAGVTATGTGAPNPPSVAGLGIGLDYLALAISAWHLTASQTLTPAHASYTLQTHVSGAATGDVAVATLAVSAGVLTIDPGAYTDNQTPNGTSSITVAVPGVSSSHEIVKLVCLGVLDAASDTSMALTNVPAVAGDLIVICCDYERTASTTLTLADNSPGGSNAYTQLVHQHWTTPDDAVTIHYAIANATAVLTITATLGANAANKHLVALTYKNVDVANPSDKEAGQNISGTNPSMTTQTPDTHGQLVVACVASVVGTAYAPAGSFVERLEIDDFQIQDQIQNLATAVGGQWTAASDDHVTAFATFRKIPPVFGELIQEVPAFEADSDPETFVFPANVTEGNLLYLAFTTNDSAVVTSVTDSLGHTYLLAQILDIPTASITRVYVAVATSSGANTITVTIVDPNEVGIGYAAEFQGPFAADPRDQESSDFAGSGTTSNTGNITPTEDGSLLVGFHLAATDLTGAGSGWTVIEDATTGLGTVLVNKKVQGTATTEASTATHSDGGWISLVANFLPEEDDPERRAQVSFAEMEVPNAPRRARVSFAEMEVPNAPRRARVSFAEMEVPNAPRRARVSFAEMETPNPPRRARVSFAEMEIPDPLRRAMVSFAEMEVPNAPRRARVSFAEMEVPFGPRRAQVSFAEMEVPDVLEPRRAQVSFAEMEVPLAPRRARVSFAELEIPDPLRRAMVSFAEMEVPNAPRRARVSFAEMEVPSPDPSRRCLVSFAEIEVPNAPRRARVSWAEMEVPEFVSNVWKIQRGHGPLAGLSINDIKVVGVRQPHIPNTTAAVNSNNIGDAPTTLNAILEALRAHGLIDS